jgi:hypothetical protein
MNVTIGASRSLGRGQAPRLLVRFLAALPQDAVILLRRPIDAPPGGFEQDTAALGRVLELDVRWFTPYPSEKYPGRSSVYVRDMDMVEEADLVLLFFTSGEEIGGYGGTSHLLDRALAAGRPVYAYGVERNGNVYRVGEYDPEHTYADITPAPEVERGRGTTTTG